MIKVVAPMMAQRVIDRAIQVQLLLVYECVLYGWGQDCDWFPGHIDTVDPH